MLSADDKPATDLITAAMIGDNDAVKALIKLGADVNAPGTGRPALLWAAQNGWLEVVQTLLGAKADVNLRDNLGLTALERAVSVGAKPAMFDVLLKAGADVNLKYPSQIYPGRTVLMMAVADGNVPAVETLLKAKADVNLSDKSGDTALTIAVFEDKPAMIPLLVKAGANVNVTRPSSGTALLFAVDNSKDEAAVALIASGADPNIAGPAGQTPLMLATRHSADMVRKLLAAKADVNARDEQSLTPLYYAIDTDNEEILNAIIAAGADVNLPLSNGDTPLAYARSHSKEDFVTLLLKAGAKDQ
jgi:ankyrin repeat protein